MSRPRYEPAQIILPLQPEDARRLHIGWRARLTLEEIQRNLALLPGRSVWNPATLEYAIAAPWRNRTDIVQIADLASIRYPVDMVRAVVENAYERGDSLTVMVEIDEVRRPSFYEQCQFEHLEKVITFDIDRRPELLVHAPAELEFTKVDSALSGVLALLMRIDHAAFPWIWWNAEHEFRTYGVTPGVEMWVGWYAGEPVGYVGFTNFGTWGHLDRIAVLPDWQGRSLGLHTLDFAVETMFRRGARSVGLSTQENNQESQRLYQRYGFVRTADNDYDLWGDTSRRKPEITQ